MNKYMNKYTDMVEKFQCPGCVAGSDTKCGAFNWDHSFKRCTGHVVGAFALGAGHIALGMPKGFDRTNLDFCETSNRLDVRFYRADEPGPTNDYYDKLNVPVWAMEHEGYLFVRVLSPRIGRSSIHVVEGGKFSDLPPNVLNIAEFVDEID